MPAVVSSVDVAAPPDKLWTLLCDPHCYPELVIPTDRMVHVPDEEMKVGYTYKEYGGVPPFKGESTWTVTLFEPITRQVHEGDNGQVRLHLDVRIESTPTGCRLTQRLELKPRWFLVLPNLILWPLMMRKRTQTAMDETAVNIQRRAESM